MEGNRFTIKGLDIHQKKIAQQEVKTRNVGKQAGEEAGDNCDWHDNFGYEEAKRNLELESKRLQDLISAVQSLVMVEIREQNERIQIGSTVVVYFSEEDKEREYTIGAFGESAPQVSLISYTSPLARVLIGMRVGDSRNIKLGKKNVEIEIVAIKPPSYRYNSLMEKMMAGELGSTDQE